MPAFKLPRLQFRIAIVDPQGRPTNTFLDFFNNQFAGKIEQQENTQAETLAALDAVQMQQAAQLVQIQEALALAGLALETADGAAGGTVRSGSDSQVVGSLPNTFTPVAQVDLLAVSAGNLTFPGSYPYLSAPAFMTGGAYLVGDYQIIEVDNGVDNGVVFTGTFAVSDVGGGSPLIINDTSSPPISSFTSARTTTNSVSYRIEAKKNNPAISLSEFGFYLFARRS